MTLKNSSRDTLLNWLIRSKKTAAWEGRVLIRWGVWMIFLIESCIAFYDKVAAIRNANRIVVGEKVGCKFVSKGVGDVAHNEVANGGGDSKGEEFGCVRGILV